MKWWSFVFARANRSRAHLKCLCAHITGTCITWVRLSVCECSFILRITRRTICSKFQVPAYQQGFIQFLKLRHGLYLGWGIVKKPKHKKKKLLAGMFIANHTENKDRKIIKRTTSHCWWTIPPRNEREKNYLTSHKVHASPSAALPTSIIWFRMGSDSFITELKVVGVCVWMWLQR